VVTLAKPDAAFHPSGRLAVSRLDMGRDNGGLVIIGLGRFRLTEAIRTVPRPLEWESCIYRGKLAAAAHGGQERLGGAV
jgi:hypothetical protein